MAKHNTRVCKLIKRLILGRDKTCALCKVLEFMAESHVNILLRRLFGAVFLFALVFYDTVTKTIANVCEFYHIKRTLSDVGSEANTFG